MPPVPHSPSTLDLGPRSRHPWVGKTAPRIHALQARLLINLGFAKAVGRGYSYGWAGGDVEPPVEHNEHFYHLHLTEDGLRWAAAGFPAITMGTTVHNVINVVIHLAITNVIQEARQVDVDQDLLMKWEALMHRLEEELEKPPGQGSFQTAKDVIETANAAKGLLGPTIKFFNEHWDKIQGWAEAAARGFDGLTLGVNWDA